MGFSLDMGQAHPNGMGQGQGGDKKDENKVIVIFMHFILFTHVCIEWFSS